MRAAILLALLLSACSTTTADFAYDPRVLPPSVGKPVVAAVAVTDDRTDESNKNYIGAIRGGFGNPLKTIISRLTVAEVVRSAFEQGLAARGLQGPGARDTLDVRVLKFSANQFIGVDVHAGFAIALRDPAGHVIYSDANDLRAYDFKFLDNGILASSDGLRQAMQSAMTQSIDELLNKPAFLAAVRAGP